MKKAESSGKKNHDKSQHDLPMGKDKNRLKIMLSKVRVPSNLMSIRFKLILSFVVPIACIIILGVVSFMKSAEGIRRGYENSTYQVINMTSEYMDLGISAVEAESNQYINNDNVKLYFSGFYKNDEYEQDIEYKDIEKSLQAKKMTDQFISDIYMFSDTMKSISTTKPKESNINTGFSETEEGEYIHNNFWGMLWLGSNEYLDEKIGVGPEKYALRLVRSIVDTDAIIVIDIDNSVIRDIFKNLQFEKTGIIGFVTSDQKEIIVKDNIDITETIFTDKEFYNNALSSDQKSGSSYVDYLGKDYLFIYSKISETGAMICSMIPKDTIYSQSDSIMHITIIIVFIACVLAVLTGATISYGIEKIIKSIISKLKETAKGDLTVDFSTNRRDEFHILLEGIQNTFTNMKEVIQQVKLLSSEVSDSSVNVTKTSEVFLKSSENITSAMNEIEQGIMQQAKDAEECLLQMDNLSKKIILVSENTNKIGRITDSTKESIDEGTKTTKNLNTQTIVTREITLDIIGEIEKLAQKSQSISAIVNVINDLANQTNLLSLNASIEAARAGEAGKGFAVVASEIRRLAEQSKASASDIKNIIDGIQNDTKKAVLTAKKAENVMLLQESAVKNTTDSYQNINESVEELVVYLKHITEDVDNIEEARVSTLGAIENISAVLEEIAASSNNVNVTSKEQLTSVETLNKSASGLSENADHLVLAIQRFKV